MVLSDPIPNVHVIGINHSKTYVNLSNLIDALNHCNIPVVLQGDFIANLMEQTTEQKVLTNCLIKERGYTQWINQYTTDYHTLIDHIYTNTPHLVKSAGTLESYYSDHKPIYMSFTAL